MKTAQEVLTQVCKTKIVDIDGNVRAYNCEEVVEAMEEYAAQFKPKNEEEE